MSHPPLHPPVSSGENITGSQTSSTRREVIRDRVLQNGSVRIDDLAGEFGVTVMTIHRDLNALEEQGWLRKVRGGATVDSSALVDTAVRHRLTVRMEEKRDIATHALRYVGQGDAVMVDDSTTALQTVELLPQRAPLTVITNFLMAINELARHPAIDLIALGGAYNPTYQAFQGLQVRDAVAKIHADVLLMSTTAILDDVLYHKSEETILVRHAMMANAARRILLVDHGKFRRRAVHQLSTLAEFDAVVVDAGIDQADLEAMRAHDVHVEVAPRRSVPDQP